MQIQKNVSLADYSSFHCGGNAAEFVICNTAEELKQAINNKSEAAITCLGFGTNILVSDKGLDGTVLVSRGGIVTQEKSGLLVAESGVWWDDLVQYAIAQQLWGVELMSGIPSSIGGAVMGNIAAYGQQVSNTLAWTEVINTQTNVVERLNARDFTYSYRFNSLQEKKNTVILRAAFKLAATPTMKLEYGSALRIAEECNLDTESLHDRRAIILEARKRAGSLYDPHAENNAYTAGSFFKNPVVPAEVAKAVIAFDESGKTEEMLLKQNKLHGGSDYRVSAAHVLLAAGFERGQTWGNVRLHPEHILKIENTGGASSQEVYDVAQLLMKTVQKKLGITLEPEVRFLGEFR